MSSDNSLRKSPAAVVLLVLLLGGLTFALPLAWRQIGFVPFLDDSWQSAGGADPLVAVVYALDLSGDAVGLGVRAHLYSALLHVLTALACLGLFLRLGFTRSRSFLATLVYLLHPAQVESVGIVALRPAILAMLCTTIALFAVAVAAAPDAPRGRRAAYSLVAFLCAGLAVSCSSLAAGLPVLAALVGARVSGRSLAWFGLTAAPVAVAATLVGWPTHAEPAQGLAPALGLVSPALPAFPLDLPLGGGSVVAAFAFMIAGAGLSLAWFLRSRGPNAAMAWGCLALSALGGMLMERGAAPVPASMAVFGLAFAVAALPLSGSSATLWGLGLVFGLGTLSLTRSGSYANGPSLYRAGAEHSPLVALLDLEGATARSTDAEREDALHRLRSVQPELRRLDDRARGLRLAIVLLTGLGRFGEATEAALALSRLADEQGDVEQRVTAYLIVVECFARESHEPGVLEYIEKVRSLRPGHPRVIAASAEQAFVELLKARRSEENDPSLGSAPGWLDAKDARIAPIRRDLAAAMAKDPDCYPALLLEGRLTEATGGVLSALPHYRRAIAVRPRMAEPRLLVTRIYFENDLLREAEATVLQAMQDRVDDARLPYWLGIIYQAQNRPDDARRYLEAYLKNRPGNREAAALLANLLSAEALRREHELDPAELRRRADRIEALNPDDPKGLLVRASALCRDKKRRDYVEAILLLETAQARMPGDAEVCRRLAAAHRDYGWMLTLLNQPEPAMDHLKTFLEIAPKDMRKTAAQNAIQAHCGALLRRCAKQNEAGDAKGAEALARRAMQLCPEDYQAHFVLGITLLGQRRHEDAVAALDRSVALASKHGRNTDSMLVPLFEAMQAAGRAFDARQRFDAVVAQRGDSMDPHVLAQLKALFD